MSNKEKIVGQCKSSVSKELEALKRIKNKFIDFFHEDNPDFDFIEQALQRLEAIDNANPSEALKNVNNILDNFGGEKVQIETMTLSKCNILTIKQTLLKAQKYEKFLDDNLIFNNGHVMSGFNYKGKQVVAMSLDEYDRLMKQEKVLEIIFEKSLNIPIFKELIRLNKPIDYMLKRFNQGREKKNQFTEEEFELLKRYCNEEK